MVRIINIQKQILDGLGIEEKPPNVTTILTPEDRNTLVELYEMYGSYDEDNGRDILDADTLAKRRLRHLPSCTYFNWYNLINFLSKKEFSSIPLLRTKIVGVLRNQS